MHEFKLPQSLTISCCDEVLNNMIEVKANNNKIHLDSSEVETLDTAGIQLIHSFCSDEEKITHINMSEKVKEMMVNLGVMPI
jgi:anti-anti-sigma regulatory factor